MPSTQPTRYNDYLVDSQTPLTPDVWNNSVGDLSKRMTEVEQKAEGYDALVNAGIGVALQRINDALTPAINQITALIQQANAYLGQLKATGQGIGASLVTTDATHQFVTADQIAAIASIATLAQQIAALQQVQAPPLVNAESVFLSTSD